MSSSPNQDNSNKSPTEIYDYLYQPKYLFLTRLLNTIIVLSLLAFIFSYWNKDTLPDKEDLSPTLFQDPLQTSTSKSPFSVPFGDKIIDVKPLADYEMWALVSSLSESSSLYSDHEPNDINVRDVCVLWGADLSPQLLSHFSSYNNGASCYPEISPFKESFKYFHVNGFDNTHLLTNQEHLRKIIHDLRIGDQIYIKGMLVSYHQSDWENFWRKSSMVNTAVGNGACKVIYVEELKILARANSGWNRLYQWSKWIAPLSLFARMIIFIL